MVLIFVIASQLYLVDSQGEEELDGIVDDLDATEDGEAGEETHCASDQSKLGLRCHLGGEGETVFIRRNKKVHHFQ